MSAMPVLAFRSTVFDVVEREGEPWLRVQQIAVALGYKRSDVLQQVYAAHAAEFTERMTALVKLPTAGGVQEVRIFSLRGAHLLGMFARTARAAEFRRWALDVLDAHVRQSAPPPFAPVDHAADVLVSADRIFRAMLRSCRAAGVPLSQAIACAGEATRRRTGVDPLAEAAAILESAATPRPVPATAPVDPWQSCIRDWLAASGVRRTSTEEIARNCLHLAVGKRGSARAVAVRIGVVMRRIGWLKRRESGGRRGYFYLQPEGWDWNQ